MPNGLYEMRYDTGYTIRIAVRDGRFRVYTKGSQEETFTEHPNERGHITIVDVEYQDARVYTS